MRFHEFNQRTDEVLPAVGAAVGAVGKVAAKGAMAAGRVGAKMGTAAAKGAGKVAAQGVKAGANMAKQAGMKMAQGVAKKAQKVGREVGDMAAQQLLKPGAELPVGGQQVKVDKVTGDEVTLADPKNKDAPKTVIKKKDPIIKTALDNMIS